MGRLDGATTLWMDGGKWVGTMTDLIWDEDGEMFRLNPRTAVWTPPDPLRRSHRRVLARPLALPLRTTLPGSLCAGPLRAPTGLMLRVFAIARRQITAFK